MGGGSDIIGEGWVRCNADCWVVSERAVKMTYNDDDAIRRCYVLGIQFWKVGPPRPPSLPFQPCTEYWD